MLAHVHQVEGLLACLEEECGVRAVSNALHYTVVQSDITAILTWVAGNHLEPNSGKCCFMLISCKRSRFIPPSTLYIDSNTALMQVISVKYLGIQLTCDLSWSSHITTICSKTRMYFCMVEEQPATIIVHVCT